MELAGVVKRTHGGVPGDNRGVLVSITRRGRALTARRRRRGGGPAPRSRLARQGVRVGARTGRADRGDREHRDLVGWLTVAIGGTAAARGCRSCWPLVRRSRHGEQRVFHAVNGLPEWLYRVLWLPMQLGNLVVGTLVGVAVALAVRRRGRGDLRRRGDGAQAGDRTADPARGRRAGSRRDVGPVRACPERCCAVTCRRRAQLPLRSRAARRRDVVRRRDGACRRRSTSSCSSWPRRVRGRAGLRRRPQPARRHRRSRCRSARRWRPRRVLRDRARRCSTRRRRRRASPPARGRRRR